MVGKQGMIRLQVPKSGHPDRQPDDTRTAVGVRLSVKMSPKLNQEVYRTARGVSTLPPAEFKAFDARV